VSPPFHAIVAALIALAAAPATDPSNACKEAAERFTAAKAQIELAVQDYAKCVAGSRGKDSCAVEFRRG
jgi:hypothetical protein